VIPFSYATSTVYKQDVQISPQYPESIIRLEVIRQHTHCSFPCIIKVQRRKEKPNNDYKRKSHT
jgi:hypothetical protein